MEIGSRKNLQICFTDSVYGCGSRVISTAMKAVDWGVFETFLDEKQLN